MTELKLGACERCGRIINHPGRCLPCNYLYKHKRYFPGLKQAPDYDVKHGFDPKLAQIDFGRVEHENSTTINSVEVSKQSLIKCGTCQNEFHPSKAEYKICYKCFSFFRNYGGIKNYGDFLDAFELTDNSETKNNYIEFVDTRSKFLEIYGDWKVDKILENPGAYLDKVAIGKRVERERLSDSIAKGENEITSLKDHLRRAEGAVREKFETELSKQEALQKERKRQLDVAKAALDIEDEELNAKYIRALQAKFHNMTRNEKGYPVFADNPKNLVHRYVYQHEYKKKYNKEFDTSKHVHHIDNNKLNSLNFWNLIDITEAQHHRIIHGKITRGDWEQGVKVMMEALGWDETNLPDHIREHMRKHHL